MLWNGPHPDQYALNKPYQKPKDQYQQETKKGEDQEGKKMTVASCSAQ